MVVIYLHFILSIEGIFIWARGDVTPDCFHTLVFAVFQQRILFFRKRSDVFLRILAHLIVAASSECAFIIFIFFQQHGPTLWEAGLLSYDAVNDKSGH